MVTGAMQSPDGCWRVEIVRRPGSRTCFYRVVHAGGELDWLSIGQVEQVLTRGGVDIATLIDVPLSTGAVDSQPAA